MAKVDTRRLLRGLEDYRKSLERHVNKTNAEFQQLENRWRALNAVYTGDAADEFRRYWLGTTSRFKEYLTRSKKIAALLDERIESLREYNRRNGL